ncbi:MAG: diguanylate cyclase [Firmicutes bacterium]|nr:diguanylate cyclase [Bacillota bacterium]
MERAEDRYLMLLNGLPDALAYCQVMTDNAGQPVDFILLSVNDAFKEMIGLLQGKVVDCRVTDVLPCIKNLEYNLIETLGKVAFTGERTSFEQYSEQANRWFRITAFSKEQGCFAVIIQDITDYRKAEQALRESETRYRELVENLNEVVYVLDENAQIIYVSPNVEQLSGYTPAELVKRRFTEFVHPEDLTGRMEQFLKVLSGVNEATEYRFITKRGQITWVRTAAKPIVSGGRTIGIQGVLMDITDRKQAEKKILRLGLQDSLTGLHNRYFMQEKIKKLDTDKLQLPVSVIMADLNGLKLINDTCGHSAGDKELQRTARLLKKSCRKKDFIARWGGDEFIILLPQTTLAEAEHVCKRITDNCRKTHVKGVPVSISLGVATKNSINKSLAKALNKAENNMYVQKLAEHYNARKVILNYLRKTLTEKNLGMKIHIERMQALAMKIGQKKGLSAAELDRLHTLIALHNIGRINLPGKIVTQKGVLSAPEKEIMQKQLEFGYRIAQATGVHCYLAEDILAHHEHWDGSGYPWGLKGKEIPLQARVIAIVDAYEVMTRGGAATVSKEEALAELKRCAGTRFDPELVEIFVGVWQEVQEL